MGTALTFFYFASAVITREGAAICNHGIITNATMLTAILRAILFTGSFKQMKTGLAQ